MLWIEYLRFFLHRNRLGSLYLPLPRHEQQSPLNHWSQPFLSSQRSSLQKSRQLNQQHLLFNHLQLHLSNRPRRLARIRHPHHQLSPHCLLLQSLHLCHRMPYLQVIQLLRHYARPRVIQLLLHLAHHHKFQFHCNYPLRLYPCRIAHPVIFS